MIDIATEFYTSVPLCYYIETPSALVFALVLYISPSCTILIPTSHTRGRATYVASLADPRANDATGGGRKRRVNEEQWLGYSYRGQSRDAPIPGFADS
ncbi:hypothetical protein BV22DRAFT_1029328 [Leucogyrophana mollusca]|uniref:Uncharacterized protein n=1 Tax=Leucogyrophana mollusca TaxID=85980 RepID=A0ACB8BW47_9AGAM|nr:hypothetical protein BV22DRAFT_1029328 [Leucogyrophana mollusca]